jgi:hypothetical protein
LREPVAVYKAVAQARLQDPSPVLDRLLRKRHIVPIYRRSSADVPLEELRTDKDPVDPDYFGITYEGRLAATERRWWEFWR